MLSLTANPILSATEQSDDLAWTFNSGSEAFDYLEDGETLVLTYTITVTDDDSIPLNDSDTLTITITGTNDTLSSPMMLMLHRSLKPIQLSPPMGPSTSPTPTPKTSSPPPSPLSPSPAPSPPPAAPCHQP